MYNSNNKNNQNNYVQKNKKYALYYFSFQVETSISYTSGLLGISFYIFEWKIKQFNLVYAIYCIQLYRIRW